MDFATISYMQLFAGEHGILVYLMDGVAVTWNGSATFNVFRENKLGELENIACFTNTYSDTNEQAQAIASNWIATDFDLSELEG